MFEPSDGEEELLRSVALQNARTLLLERQRVEAALRESEERYRALIQAITSVVWTTDAEGCFVAPQPSWSSFTGQTWEEMRGFGWVDALHPQDRERVRSTWAAALAARTGYGADGRLWHAASGSYRRFEARGVPILNADGSVREWIGKYLDVEDRKRAEERLHRSVETITQLVDQSPFGVYTVDSDFRIAQVSAGAKAVFCNVRPLIGHDFSQAIRTVWPEPFASDVIERFRRTLETGEPYIAPSLTARRVDLDAVECYEWQIHRVRLARGGEGVVCYFFDTTQLRQAEEQLRRYGADLADADRRKNEFLAMLAHELRNPLAPMHNALQIVKRAGANDEDVASATAMLERQLGQLVRLVDDLLDVSRVSRGKIALRRNCGDLASTVLQAVEAARPLCESMGHELTVTLPQQPIYLDVDQTRLVQVVGNLLNNACKFTDRGGRIALTVEQEGGQAVIRVRDSGIGIAADQLAHIFELFMQVDTSLERAASGLGIGLTLAKDLVELHGGTLQASSPGIGQGSEFVVRLPIALGASAPLQPAPRLEVASHTQPRRILVVDDNRDSAASLAMVLQLSGYQTHIVHDGLEAVQAAAAFRPDVMLLDIGLPKLNGYQVARKIREQPWGHDIHLIALTGWGQVSDRQLSRDAGFGAHLVKPVDLDALLKLLAESTAQGRPGPADAALCRSE